VLLRPIGESHSTDSDLHRQEGIILQEGYCSYLQFPEQTTTSSGSATLHRLGLVLC
jgi:hypothetical protein